MRDRKAIVWEGNISPRSPKHRRAPQVPFEFLLRQNWHYVPISVIRLV